MQGKDESVVRGVIERALSLGVNFFDAFMSEPNVRDYIGLALEGQRERALIQGHFGAVWLDGQYAARREPELNKRFFEDLLTRLKTDYIDVGMIHFIDDVDEWERFAQSETYVYIVNLKKSGVIRSIGLSTHSPIVATKAVENELIEVLMFSLNPAFDVLSEDMSIEDLFELKAAQADSLTGLNPIRAALYRLCESRGVAITVMKALGAGILLNGDTSPFGRALTVDQLLHYALTRPAVSAVMLGVHTPEEVSRGIQYYESSPEERDYSVVLAKTRQYSAKGRCMYCNHCLPCPAEIDIAQVHKYLDMAEYSGDHADSIKTHYLNLRHTASECQACGACEKRCPFTVDVIHNMKRAADKFGQ
jgi:predicted aldo/keto reductase-like oxidoreductase